MPQPSIDHHNTQPNHFLLSIQLHRNVDNSKSQQFGAYGKLPDQLDGSHIAKRQLCYNSISEWSWLYF